MFAGEPLRRVYQYIEEVKLPETLKSCKLTSNYGKTNFDSDGALSEMVKWKYSLNKSMNDSSLLQSLKKLDFDLSITVPNRFQLDYFSNSPESRVFAYYIDHPESELKDVNNGKKLFLVILEKLNYSSS